MRSKNNDWNFDLDATRAQLTVLSGEPDPTINWRAVPESQAAKKRFEDAKTDAEFSSAENARRLKFRFGPRNRRGKLSELGPWLKRQNLMGKAIYFGLHPTDGQGTRTLNVTHVRCVVADFDGSPLPANWDWLEPHCIVETSPNKYQCIWRTALSTEFTLYENLVKRVATYYGSDPKVSPITQVFRAAGFFHQKGEKRFRSSIFKQGNDGEPYQLGEFDYVFPDLPEEERSLNQVKPA